MQNGALYFTTGLRRFACQHAESEYDPTLSNLTPGQPFKWACSSFNTNKL